MYSSPPSVFITFSFLLLASILIPSAAAAASRATPSDGDRELLERFEQWAVEFGRRYEDADEKEARFEAFKENLQFIEAFNSNGSLKFNLGLNGFADLTTDEFNRMIGPGFPPPVQRAREGFRYENVSLMDLPVAVDWRMSRTVTPVKKQGGCGSCWVFAAVATVESLHKIITGQLVRLSEQEVLDCEPSNACKGGYPEVVYNFARRGLVAEADYPPYRGVDTNSCDKSKASMVTASITGYEVLPMNDEEAMMRAVANQPIYVNMLAGSSEFRLFTGDGVFNAMNCGTAWHAVMLIGYGTESDGTKYWLIKNSWGTGWGNGGFGKIARQTGVASGVCNITRYSIYPNVWHPKL